MVQKTHTCLNGERSVEPSWWEKDGQGIPLARVCVKCRDQKLKGYRPEILKPYTQKDLDEPIDDDGGW